MPRAKTEKIVGESNGWQTVEIEAAAGGENKGTKTAQFVRPVSPNVLTTYLVDNGDKVADYAFFFPGTDAKNETETVGEFIRRMFAVSLDRKARADVYESIAAESTMITVGKEKVDIMDFPAAKLVKAINGMRAQVEVRDTAGTDDSRKAAEKSVGYGPWRTAAGRLVEEGKAKENDATGMLELLAV